VECLTELEDCGTLRGISQLRVVDVAPVQRSSRSEPEASIDTVVFKVKHGRPRSRIFAKDLLDQKQHSRLEGRLKMQLEQSKALDEGIDCLNSDLLPLKEDNLHTLQERCKVLGLSVGRPRLLKQPLNDSVQCVDEVLLVHLERSRACVKDLKCAEQTC